MRIIEAPIAYDFAKIRHKKLFTVVLIVAFLFKLSIFVFGVMRVPNSIFSPDSESYLLTAKTIYTQGVFGVQDINGVIRYEVYRTPGYPIFLAILHNAMGIPLIGVILLQILFAIIAGLITYRIANEIDYKIGILSMAIALFDPPTSIYSLKILSEVLYLSLLFLFIYITIRYFKSGKMGLIILSALVLVVTTYVRPISYFLGIGVAIFIIYANSLRNFKKTLVHAAVFLIIIYSFLGIWQIRNFKRAGTILFSTVGHVNSQGLALVKNVEKNNNYFVQGINYVNVAGQSFINIMTLPGSLKYYKSKLYAIFGKILFYSWMGFWLIGFLVGCVQIKGNIYYQFLLWIMLYFVAVTVVNISVVAGERFRIPMVACIAVISAHGWLAIKYFWAEKLRQNNKERL